MNAPELAKTYVAATNALRDNTAAVMELIQGGQVDSPEFKQLWQQREFAFTEWNNAALAVRDLPVDGMNIVIQEIDRMK